MGMAQRTALNKTALQTAGWLSRWGRALKAEMEKQNISRHAEVTKVLRPEGKRFFNRFSYTTDDDEIITFRRGQIRRLLDEMAHKVKELERFEKKLPSNIPDTE